MRWKDVHRALLTAKAQAVESNGFVVTTWPSDDESERCFSWEERVLWHPNLLRLDPVGRFATRVDYPTNELHRIPYDLIVRVEVVSGDSRQTVWEGKLEETP